MIHYFQLKNKSKQLNQSVNLCSNLCGSVSEKGFTLIELLIYSGILVIVLTFTGEYLYSIGQARINNTARVEVSQAAQLVINKTKLDITNSSEIINPTGSESSPSLILIADEGLINYSLVGNDLIRKVDDNPDKLNSNQVIISNLSFNKVANLGGTVTVQIKFTITSLAQLSGGRNLEESFQTTFSTR